MSVPRYPDLPIDADTWPTYKDGRLLDESMDGIEAERLIWPGQRIARLTLTHPFLNDSEVQQLFDFYSANPFTPFELSFRGEIVICKFIGRPRKVASRGWWTSMQATVREV
ncbi:MAG: hypothetical protein FWC38_05970 [Proteobacteria bacterium]|nr:hypothetical protein [Pseudomonadota bacterium]MCL2307757.1 hypothetical protein [Pseudomonadota bacterium]